MYIIERTMIVEKQHTKAFLNKLATKGVIEGFKGFVEKQVLLDDSKKEDVIKVLIFWKNKESFAAWHQSDEHKAMHQHKDDSKPEGLLNINVSRYTLISKSHYE